MKSLFALIDTSAATELRKEEEEEGEEQKGPSLSQSPLTPFSMRRSCTYIYIYYCIVYSVCVIHAACVSASGGLHLSTRPAADKCCSVIVSI